jgi:hypothetical protein
MSLEGWALRALIGLFGAAAAVVWLAGIRLSETTDVLSTRLGLGEALGGLLLLAVATNLPEIAMVARAAVGGDLGIAIGNGTPQDHDPVEQCAGLRKVPAAMPELHKRAAQALAPIDIATMK